MQSLKLLIQGIVIGIGAISPGISGSILMVVFGLYTKVIQAIATLFKNFRKNLFFLFPIGIGILIGIVTFSRLINHSLDYFEIPTRLAFLGLLIGTIPIFFKEVNRHGRPQYHHFVFMAVTFCLSLVFLTFSSSAGVAPESTSILQSFSLGLVGISATIIPGISGVALLSSFGLYEKWLDLTSLTNIDLAVYIPAGIGILFGVFAFAILISKLLKNYYTATFTILFGLFLSIIPSVLRSPDGNFIPIGLNSPTTIGIILFTLGILASYAFGYFGYSDKTKRRKAKNPSDTIKP